MLEFVFSVYAEQHPSAETAAVALEKWTNQAKPPLMDATARNGHLDMLKYLYGHPGWGCTTDAMDIAAAHGHLDVVKWLFENRLEGCTQKVMDDAVSGGYLDVVQYLYPRLP